MLVEIGEQQPTMPRLIVHGFTISLAILRGVLVLLASIVAGSNASAQDYIPELAQKHIVYFESLESSLGSEPYAYRSRLMTPLSQPVCFVRTDKNFRPRPLVSYLYSRNDSIVRQIEVEMDSLNFLPQTYDSRNDYHERKERKEEYLQVYDSMLIELALKLGPSTKQEPLYQHDNMGHGWFWRRSNDWENDTMSVDLTLMFSDTANGDYRIRFYCRWKYDTTPGLASLTSNFKGKEEQERTAQEYLDLLLKKKYKESWALIDDELKALVNYETYVERVSPMADDAKKQGRKVELYMTSLMQDMTGGVRPTYVFKYASDKSNPPQRTITVTFKSPDGSLVYGVAPRHRISMKSE
jgi:hypothetical protein